MKKIFLALSLIALTALVVVPAKAETNSTSSTSTATSTVKQNSQMSVMINPAGHAKIEGTVTAVSSSSLSVASWGGTWTVNYSGDVHTRFGRKVALSNVKVGDRVAVAGKISGNSLVINAAQIRDISLDSKTKVSWTSSSTDGKNYTVTLKNGQVVNVSLGSSSASSTAKEGKGLKGILNSLAHKVFDKD